MTRKLLLSGILIVSAFLLMGFNFSYPWTKAEKNIVPVKSEVKKADQVIVYYFYAKPRCVSCQKIEKYTKETVSSLNNSKVVYQGINLDDKANEHYKKDYALFSKAVVLSKIVNGKQTEWKTLNPIWTKLGNEKDFKGYVTEQINTYLGE
ncbi:MAG: hypothetical protein A2Y25_08470 [Candidatus Melainabacteria bacterium GWF2_37_15]|nr:MAG: hypothetical protein A2Y25_08470 [Candidatus Melainabacteria bacterium GWF2_37_15]